MMSCDTHVFKVSNNNTIGHIDIAVMLLPLFFPYFISVNGFTLEVVGCFSAEML